MTKDLAVVEKVIELTNSDKINWKNYKDQKPKELLMHLILLELELLPNIQNGF